MTRTTIEWTDDTWNPVTGCDKVSPGCDTCYAETIAHRFAGGAAFPDGFAVTLRPARLDEPLHWRKPRRVFVNSMSDLFHDAVSRDFLADVFSVMAWASKHTFQILTKRHGRMRSVLSDPQFWVEVGRRACQMGHRYGLTDSQFLADGQNIYDLDGWARRRSLPNVWLGVSVEDQKRADLRIPALLDTPAAVRFLSCEPLLGPVQLDLDWLGGRCCPRCGEYWDVEGSCSRLHDAMIENPGGIGWVIVGGESGQKARPMHPAWARALRDQCTAAGVPFFFKQHGEWAASPQQDGFWESDHDVRADGYHWPISQPHGAADGTEVVMRRVGKKTAGRVLDGRTWDQFPAPRVDVLACTGCSSVLCPDCAPATRAVQS